MAAHIKLLKKGVIAPESNAAIRAMPAALLTLADGKAAIFVRKRLLRSLDPLAVRGGEGTVICALTQSLSFRDWPDISQ